MKQGENLVTGIRVTASGYSLVQHGQVDTVLLVTDASCDQAIGQEDGRETDEEGKVRHDCRSNNRPAVDR